jgi:hypothetical protein
MFMRGGTDVRRRDVHDRCVQHEYQLAGQDEGEDETGVPVGEPAGVGPTARR